MNQLPLLNVNHFFNKLNIVSTEIFFISGFIVFFFLLLLEDVYRTLGRIIGCHSDPYSRKLVDSVSTMSLRDGLTQETRYSD